MPEPALPDLLGNLETSIEAFFERWLIMNKESSYYAGFLQRATIGMCKNIARHETVASGEDAFVEAMRVKHAEMICDMLLTTVQLGPR